MSGARVQICCPTRLMCNVPGRLNEILGAGDFYLFWGVEDGFSSSPCFLFCFLIFFSRGWDPLFIFLSFFKPPVFERRKKEFSFVNPPRHLLKQVLRQVVHNGSRYEPKYDTYRDPALESSAEIGRRPRP